VGPIAIVFGAILIVLGVGGYLATMISWTALIPAILGVILLLLGLLARQEKMRMHAMHGAALVGLVGILGGGWRVIAALRSDNPINELAFGMNVAMAVTCAIFLALCVKSFIDARRRRKAAQS
jgi:membrane-bound ClpP family serine protease